MSGRAWTDTEVRRLSESFADSRTEEIAQALGRTYRQVAQKAAALGLRKSEQYLASDNAGRIQRGKQHPAMRATQFQPGLTPWNKGAKGVTGVQEACRATQFKKGRPAHEARNYVPIGTLRLSKDGYLERKVTDDPGFYPARRWVAEPPSGVGIGPRPGSARAHRRVQAWHEDGRPGWRHGGPA